MRSRRILLVTVGSHGDVYPFIGVGMRLREQGHAVTLVTSEPYRADAEKSGLEFEPLLAASELHALLANPDSWHPIKSALIGARWGRSVIRRFYDRLAALSADPGTLLVAYPPVFSARLVQEKLGRPLVSLVSSPWMIPSAVAPPVLSTGTNLSKGAPLWARRAFWHLLHNLGDFLIGRHLNQTRRALGLTPVRHIFKWWYSPQQVIALFPDWFAPPASDWPPNLRMAGFPLFSVGGEGELASEIRSFCEAGPPPVVFTFGSAMLHAREMFAAAAGAAEQLGLRALLVTNYSDQLPSSLPPGIRACGYAPFNRLFPLCRAIVHHGGIGTTSQAFAAGKPQLVLPMAWDQPDNAMRIERLGAGASLRGRISPGRIALALTKVLTPDYSRRAMELSSRLQPGHALAQAAEWIGASASSKARDGGRGQ